MNIQRTRRLAQAYFRDTRVLVRQFHSVLLLFAILLLIGTVVLHFTYDAGNPLDWGAAFHTAFKLMFFETVGDYPSHPLAQLVYLLWPIMGLVMVVNGMVRFGTALFNRQERKEAWQVAVASTYHDHVVVCGLGKVGCRVVSQLIGMQQSIIGIEANESAVFLERVRKEGVTVLMGDARSRELLEKAGIKEAAAVVACTESDLTNLEIALEARELNPNIKVVMRMFDQELAERVRKGFGIKTAFSTSALAAPAFAAAATRAAVEYSFYVEDVLLNISRVTVPSGSPLVGMRVGEVEQTLDLSIVLYQGPEGMDLHPTPELVLAGESQIVVLATLESLARLGQMNKREEEYQSQKRGGKAWLDRLRRKKRG